MLMMPWNVDDALNYTLALFLRIVQNALGKTKDLNSWSSPKQNYFNEQCHVPVLELNM